MIYFVATLINVLECIELEFVDGTSLKFDSIDETFLNEETKEIITEHALILKIIHRECEENLDLSKLRIDSIRLQIKINEETDETQLVLPMEKKLYEKLCNFNDVDSKDFDKEELFQILNSGIFKYAYNSDLIIMMFLRRILSDFGIYDDLVLINILKLSKKFLETSEYAKVFGLYIGLEQFIAVSQYRTYVVSEIRKEYDGTYPPINTFDFFFSRFEALLNILLANFQCKILISVLDDSQMKMFSLIEQKSIHSHECNMEAKNINGIMLLRMYKNPIIHIYENVDQEVVVFITKIMKYLDGKSLLIDISNFLKYLASLNTDILNQVIKLFDMFAQSIYKKQHNLFFKADGFKVSFNNISSKTINHVVLNEYYENDEMKIFCKNLLTKLNRKLHINIIEDIAFIYTILTGILQNDIALYQIRSFQGKARNFLPYSLAIESKIVHLEFVSEFTEKTSKPFSYKVDFKNGDEICGCIFSCFFVKTLKLSYCDHIYAIVNEKISSVLVNLDPDKFSELIQDECTKLDIEEQKTTIQKPRVLDKFSVKNTYFIVIFQKTFKIISNDLSSTISFNHISKNLTHLYLKNCQVLFLSRFCKFSMITIENSFISSNTLKKKKKQVQTTNLPNIIIKNSIFEDEFCMFGNYDTIEIENCSFVLSISANFKKIQFKGKCSNYEIHALGGLVVSCESNGCFSYNTLQNELEASDVCLTNYKYLRKIIKNSKLNKCEWVNTKRGTQKIN